MANLMKIFKDVAQEREIQKGRWGDTHDDSHSGHEWANVMGSYMGRIHTELLGLKAPPSEEAAVRWQEFDESALRIHIIKVITTGAAWIEAIDRRREASEQARRELAQQHAGEVVEGSGKVVTPIVLHGKKCGTCWGNGLWPDTTAPMGPIDASDGMMTIACPECGANPNPRPAVK